MKTIDYKTDHLFGIHINFSKYPICRGNIVLLNSILLNGISKTIITDKNEILAIISVFILHPGVATVYIVPSVDAHDKKTFSFIKGVLLLREELESIVRIYKLRRVETLTMDDKKHNRWMEYLGFLADGTKQSFGINGEDFIMWSRIWV